jgi:hypothetical protein
MTTILLTLIARYYNSYSFFANQVFPFLQQSICPLVLLNYTFNASVNKLSPSLLEIQCIIFIRWSFIFCLSSIYVICLWMYDWPMTHYIFNLYSPNHMKKCKIAISCFLKLFKKYRSFCIHWIYRSNTSTKTFFKLLLYPSFLSPAIDLQETMQASRRSHLSSYMPSNVSKYLPFWMHYWIQLDEGLRP